MTLPIRRLRESLRAFADTVGPSTIGHSLTEAQERAFDLDKRHTAVIAPRQSGKSDALALLAAWHAFSAPSRAVLVVSASEDSARRLLGRVRVIGGHDLLRGSVVDEQAGKVVLSNGSTIVSVSASERAVRGHTATLLVLDEAALIPDDLALSAALPTVAARPEAHVVACSTPFSTSGFFYDWCMGQSQHTAVRSWSVADAPWLTPTALAALRESLGEFRYRIEVECSWLGRVNGLFSPEDLLRATCDYRVLVGGTVSVGCDWSGQSRDPHAVVALAVADDHGANERPVLIFAVADSQHAPYAEQIDWIASLGERFDLASRRCGSVPAAARPRHGHRTRSSASCGSLARTPRSGCRPASKWRITSPRWRMSGGPTRRCRRSRCRSCARRALPAAHSVRPCRAAGSGSRTPPTCSDDWAMMTAVIIEGLLRGRSSGSGLGLR